MSPLPTIVILLCNTLWVLSSEIKSMGVTFEELHRLNISCNATFEAPLYSCQERRKEKFNTKSDNACHCDSSCSVLGTCCLDSSFQEWNQKTALGFCKTVQDNFRNYYLLISKCPSTENTNDAFQTLCEDEQNAEDDLMSRLPVTSLSSSLRYKNYFCFRCHESHDDYTFWNVSLTARVEFKNRRFEELNLTYNKASGKWFASDGENDTMHQVYVNIYIPRNIRRFTKTCPKYLISSCSEQWPQDEIREKCSMYMFVIDVKRNGSYLLYKNPHCALCNFEVLKDYSCMFIDDHPLAFGFGQSRKLYSFTLIMDIGRKEGEKVGKTQRCDDAEVWDPLFKKCRKIICALPRYTIKDGKCKPE